MPTHLGCIGAGCPICHKMNSDPRKYAHVAAALSAPGGPAPAAKAVDGTRCAHFGGFLETVACPTCPNPGRTKAKVFACSVHGKCSPFERAIPGVKSCATCGDHREPRPAESRPPAGARHLACHVMPTRRDGGIAWRLACEQLRSRWSLFTGRKVVAVVTGADLDSADAVRAALPPDAEVFEAAANDPTLREVATWEAIWSRILPRAGADDAALYCHAKGVSRPYDAGGTPHSWASLLWSLSLDHWPLVSELLGRHPIAGSLKKVGAAFGPDGGTWHYSGSFFWARVADLRRRLEQYVTKKWYGVELWPGIVYAAGEAATIFLESATESMDLYDPKYWADTVRPEYEKWIQRNPPAWPPAPTPSAGGSSTDSSRYYVRKS